MNLQLFSDFVIGEINYSVEEEKGYFLIPKNKSIEMKKLSPEAETLRISSSSGYKYFLVLWLCNINLHLKIICSLISRFNFWDVMIFSSSLGIYYFAICSRIIIMGGWAVMRRHETFRGDFPNCCSLFINSTYSGRNGSSSLFQFQTHLWKQKTTNFLFVDMFIISSREADKTRGHHYYQGNWRIKIIRKGTEKETIW